MTPRLYKGEEAQAEHTPLEGGILGWLAILMLAVFLVAARLTSRNTQSLIFRIARIWVAGLFCFFAGVHRGASFYSPEGPRLSDPLIFLTMHFGGLSLALVPSRTAWRLTPAGMLLTLGGDLFLAQQNRLPRFFLRLRPLQLIVATLLISRLGSASRSGAEDKT
ncbi:hypothetical protein [Acetobacter cibinongensis]|uniref:Uncharacterized protein n=1 Tax=Acetobacter cibinongensis TaxID=146475 RepID=A0A1Z5YWH8_9PROT|nr:hypothetical protein [Acetobacter cibinongensis]OUJ03401.1 hypothetical protein HK14_02240 [Acetobacter cibinongensis]